MRAGACVSDACICAEQSLQTRFYSSKNTLLLLLLVIRNGEVRVNSNYIHDGVQHDNLRLKVNTLALLLVTDNVEVRVNANYIHDGVHHGNPRLKAW